MLRVCVIGMAYRQSSCPVVQQIAGANLIGVCDIVRERADAAAQKLGVGAFYDVPTMLAALKPDIVSVTTAGVENGSDHYLPPSRLSTPAAMCSARSHVQRDRTGRGHGRQGPGEGIVPGRGYEPPLYPGCPDGQTLAG